jgi:folate-dependent tRNA-U54 methylase TrmFO/GidA
MSCSEASFGMGQTNKNWKPLELKFEVLGKVPKRVQPRKTRRRELAGIDRGGEPR